ncbi:MAG TPA: DUF6339 family protein [Kofleriaceae bacterium]|nr:DUF6339 family protein [Kofleriaceae bacterium]
MTSIVNTGLKTSVRSDLTTEFLSKGQPLPNLTRHELPLSSGIDIDPLRKLLDEGVKRKANGAFKTAFDYDGWLAPRVHYCLRLTNRQASLPELWLRLSIVDCSDYVRSRWATPEGVVNRYRYTGEPQFLRRNALSRLWWAAENARNGDDYGPVVVSLANAGVDQYLFDLRYSHYRPAVIALLDALQQKPLGFDQMKKLSNTLNVALGSRCLESMGGMWIEGDDPVWLAASPDPNQAIQANLSALAGPATGKIDLSKCKELRDWLGGMVAQVGGR